MKKTFLFILLLISLFTALSAQETLDSADSALEQVNEQYETFSWSPVAKAKQYGVTIEKLDSETDEWVPFKEVKTKDPSLEVLFTPGTYRVSICVYNFIGKKSQPTDWVQFQILEENVPYLNDKAFVKHSEWKVPVLYLNNTDKKIDASEFISTTTDFGPNTLYVKGRNIFSPKTEFYLVPKEHGGEKPFVSWGAERKEQKLNILYRNSKEYSVVVSYNPALLSAGYYALEVRNQGDNKADVDILVLDSAELQITPDKGFAIDEHYSVNSITLQGSSNYDFSVSGTGLNSTTEFYFEPTVGPYAYPFETELNRTRSPLLITDTNKIDSSKVEISLSCDSESLRSGYYNLVAKNWDGTTSKFLCLVKKPFNNDYTKNVQKFKSKFNKRTEYVDVTLQDGKFSADKIYTLVSEYDSNTDSNNRVPLHLSVNGKKLVGKLSPTQLTIAKYALMIEDEFSSSVIYCAIDSTLKISMNKMNDLAVEKTFFRPVGKDSEITLDADDVGAVLFSDSKVQMKKRMPPLFSYFRFDISILNEGGILLDTELDLLHFNYASWSIGYENKRVDSDMAHAVFSMLRFSIPNEYFSPYLGVGAGINLIFPEDGISSYEDVLPMFKNTDEIYGIAQIGASLLTILDVRYNLFLNNLLTGSPYFSDSVSIGTTFPLRSFKFKRKVLTQAAQITKEGAMNITNYIEPSAKIDNVKVLQSTSVGGFEGYDNIENISLDKTVQVIEENAFKNCTNLETVSFEDRYASEDTVPLTIKSRAFEGAKFIDTIYLPYRTAVVEAGAFANWTNGQNIILCWNGKDLVQRDLSGLKNCSATVHYDNGDLFTGSFENPLDDERNWVPLNDLKIENVSIFENDQYILGMRLKGLGNRWYMTELDRWINQDSPAPVINYIKSGDRIKFKVQGDGNAYNFIITTDEGGYFYYKFKTKKDKVLTIEIPYKRMSRFGFSSQKKLDIEKIRMVCIMPMCKGEWNEVSFFDFEVGK